MKQLKQLIYLCVAIAFLVSCQDQTTDEPSLQIEVEQEIDLSEIHSLLDAIEAGIDVQAYLNTLPKIEKVRNKTISEKPENGNLQFIFNPNDFPCSNELPTESFDEVRNDYNWCAGNYIDESTSYSSFSPGDILPGISFESPYNYSCAMAMYSTVNSNWDTVLADNSGNDLIINFSTGNVTSVGFDVYTHYSNIYVYIDVYGENGLLGSTSVSAAVTLPSYFAVISSELITKIVINSSSGWHHGIDNVSFGNCNDYDGDGCLNEDDAHPFSNLNETVVIDGCDSGVENGFSACGTTMMDEIDDLIAEISAKAQEPRNRYQRAYKAQSAFKMGMYFLLAKWQSKRYITRSENSAIMKCVGRSSINFKDDGPR